jgi:diguanylate cyclase (GGDEF)-like protein
MPGAEEMQGERHRNTTQTREQYSTATSDPTIAQHGCLQGEYSSTVAVSLRWDGNHCPSDGTSILEAFPDDPGTGTPATTSGHDQPALAKAGAGSATSREAPGDSWLVTSFAVNAGSAAGHEIQLEHLRTLTQTCLERDVLRERVATLEKAERVQQALFAIADLANSDLEMHTVLQGIHQTVAGLMYAKNFFIALFNESSQTISFAYFVDTVDTNLPDVGRELPVSELSDSLTWGLIRQGKPMTGPSIQLAAALGIRENWTGTTECEHWLGVPLLDGKQVRGAVVVQSYDPLISYTQQDVELLCYVAQQILATIDRKQAHDQLERRVVERTEALEKANRDLHNEIEIRRRAEQLQEVQRRIAELSMSSIEMETFYLQVHRLVSCLLIADNFTIALVSPCGNKLEFPYAVDQQDPPPTPRSFRNGLTEYVIRSQRPLLADRSAILQLQAIGEVIPIGTIPVSWMGVPLLVDNEVLGAIAVQSYSNEVQYSSQDQNLLNFVALHIASGLQRRRAQNKIVHLALYDRLTDLPNRSLFMERLEITRRRYSSGLHTNYGVLFLDLDRFKMINDSMGHHAGDLLLKVVAQRLSGSVRPQDTVSRFGGDEFAVLINGIGAETEAINVAKRIQAALETPIPVNGHELFITSSIGVAFPHSNNSCAEELLRNADAAMYHAKRLGPSRWHIFDEALHNEAVQSLALETDLRRAVSARQFEPFFQPIVRLEDGRTVGFEALLRWRHDSRGLLSPASFLDAAKDSGLMEAIDWMMYEATAKASSKRLSPGQYVSVNVCPSHLNSPLFPDRVLGMLARHGIDPAQFRIEVTEDALLNDSPRVRECLLQLEESGIKTMVDDFGKGYSALSYLHTFRFCALKVDRSFIAQLEEGTAGGIAIMRAVLGICEALGISVIAEGVESDLQYKALKSLGCTLGQGFLFSHPFPASDWPESH